MKLSDFAAAILDADRPTPNGVVDPQGRPAGKRFDVYRNNVVHSLSEALSSAYPVVEKLVGDKFFKAMAGVFVRQHPPVSPLMFQFAQEFPGFLAAFPPVAHLPYLPDVARLERSRRQAYHATDAAPIDGAVLMVATPAQLESARLGLHPSTRIVRSEYPILAIWQNNNGEDIDIPLHGQDVLISRPFDGLQMRSLPAGAADFLTALQSGKTLSQASDAGAQTTGFDLTQNIAGILSAKVLIKTIIEGK